MKTLNRGFTRITRIAFVDQERSARSAFIRGSGFVSPWLTFTATFFPALMTAPKSWEMTAEMCRVAAEDGITHIVATPHCNDEFVYDRDRYAEMLGELCDIAEGRLGFSLGCDFHFSYDNIRDALAHPRAIHDWRVAISAGRVQRLLLFRPA